MIKKFSKNRKILISIVILILMSASFSTICSSTNIKKISQKVSDSQNDEYHLIEGVPYILKKDGLACEYTPLEMVFKYYGINLTATEIFYSIGGGYAQGYGVPLHNLFEYPYRKLPYKFICAGDRTLGGTEDYKFLANLYGCSFDYMDYDLVTNKEKCWEESWQKIKYYVNNDNPVISTVDPLSWPPYREYFNKTTKPTIFGRSCCVIVVVGYNETNNTICFNDQYIGEDKGKYQWIGIDEFKTATGRPMWEMNEMRYAILLLRKTSEPLPTEFIVDAIHERNIKKMIGLKDAYDSDFVHENFKNFGIDSLESFKNDIKNILIKRIPFYKILYKFLPSFEYPFARISKYLEKEALNKKQIASFMFNNVNISNKYYCEALILERESACWENLTNLTIMLKDVVFMNPTYKAIKLSRPILDEMSDTVDDIIIYHKMIIAQSGET